MAAHGNLLSASSSASSLAYQELWKRRLEHEQTPKSAALPADPPMAPGTDRIRELARITLERQQRLRRRAAHTSRVEEARRQQILRQRRERLNMYDQFVQQKRPPWERGPVVPWRPPASARVSATNAPQAYPAQAARAAEEAAWATRAVSRLPETAVPLRGLTQSLGKVQVDHSDASSRSTAYLPFEHPAGPTAPFGATGTVAEPAEQAHVVAPQRPHPPVEPPPVPGSRQHRRQRALLGANLVSTVAAAGDAPQKSPVRRVHGRHVEVAAAAEPLEPPEPPRTLEALAEPLRELRRAVLDAGPPSASSLFTLQSPLRESAQTLELPLRKETASLISRVHSIMSRSGRDAVRSAPTRRKRTPPASDAVVDQERAFFVLAEQLCSQSMLTSAQIAKKLDSAARATVIAGGLCDSSMQLDESPRELPERAIRSAPVRRTPLAPPETPNGERGVSATPARWIRSAPVHRSNHVQSRIPTRPAPQLPSGVAARGLQTMLPWQAQERELKESLHMLDAVLFRKLSAIQSCAALLHVPRLPATPPEPPVPPAPLRLPPLNPPSISTAAAGALRSNHGGLRPAPPTSGLPRPTTAATALGLRRRRFQPLSDAQRGQLAQAQRLVQSAGPLPKRWVR